MKRILTIALLGAGLTLGAASATPAMAATSLGGVDMQQACNTQYPSAGLIALVTDSNSAFSWRCVNTTSGFQIGINVNTACASQYGAGATAAYWDAGNPYSWYCQR